MLDFLADILHGILDLPYLVVDLLVKSLNGWILILALAKEAVMALLPGFPEVPSLNGDVISGVAWFLPIGPMMAIFTTFITAWVLWLGVAQAFRWAKAL
jgi:hypothetical protein